MATRRSKPYGLNLSKLPASGDREGWYSYYIRRHQKGVAGSWGMASFYLDLGLKNNEAWAIELAK